MKKFITLVLFEYKTIIKSKTTIIIFFLLTLLVVSGGLLLNNSSTKSIETIFLDNRIDINIEQLENEMNQYSQDISFKIVQDEKKEKNYPHILLKQKNDIVTLDVYYENKSQENVSLEQILITTISNNKNKNLLSSNEYINVLLNKDYLNENNPMLVSLIIIMIIYLFTVLCGSTITNSVALDKLNNIFDMLTFKVKASTIVYSKIASVILIVCQVAMMLATEMLLLSLLNIININSVINSLNDLNLSSLDLIYIILFSFLGCLLYTLLYSISGILVTSIPQIQFAQLPVSILLMISTFLGIYGIYDQNIIYKVSLYIPLVSPFTVPVAILNNQITVVGIASSSFIFIFIIIIISIVINKKILPGNIK